MAFRSLRFSAPFAFALVSSASAQVTASYSLGAPGCNGSAQTRCIALNDANPVLQVVSAPNEFAYPVLNTSGLIVRVVGFEIYTQSNSGTTTEVGNTGFCWDNSGWAATVATEPTAAWTATGTITVGPSAGWYATTLVPPVFVLPGEVFWITADAFDRIAPPQHVSAGGVNPPGSIYERRPTVAANAWRNSSNVHRPIYRIRCAIGTTIVPYLAANQPPRLGQSITITLGGGLPSSTGFLVFSSSATSWFGLPTPVDLALFGAPHCAASCSFDHVFPLPLDTQGEASITGTVPNYVSFRGLSFYNQALVVSPGTNAISLLVSNLGTGVIGS